MNNELEKWLAEVEAVCEKATRNCHRNGCCVATVEGGEQGIVNYDEDGNQCVQRVDRFEEVKVGEFGTEEDAEFDVRARAALPLALKMIRAGQAAGASSAMRAVLREKTQ
jgi:hypothetical protein